MNKAELIKAASEETGFTQADVTRILDATLGTIKAQILAGNRVTIFGLGTFNLVTRPPRTVQSRLMGGGQVAEKAAPRVVPERKVVKFKAAKQFKEAAAG